MRKDRGNKADRKLEESIRVFLKSSGQPKIDDERKRQTLELLRMERKRLHVRSKKPYGQRVLEQVAYISPAVWLIQGTLLLFLLWGFCVRERQEILINLLFCAPMIGIVGFTEIMRSYWKNMWELEQACRYNLRQLLGMRLLIFGVVDFLVTYAVAMIGYEAGIKAWELLFFFFVPQMLSDCVYLYLLTKFRRRFQGSALLGAAVLMSFFWMSLLSEIFEHPQWIQRLADPLISVSTLLACAVLLALCCVRFLKETEIEYGIA